MSSMAIAPSRITLLLCIVSTAPFWMRVSSLTATEMLVNAMVCFLELLSFPSYLFIQSTEEKRLDRVDKIIWVLPFLGVLDVLSTLYAEGLGYPLALYEAGSFARSFASVGLTYVYIVIYLLSMSAFAYVLWFIKNKKLDSSLLFDKVIFLLLVGVACYIYMRLTAAFIGNFSLPYFVAGRVSWFSVSVLTYLSTAFSLTLYLWRDVGMWVKANDSKKE